MFTCENVSNIFRPSSLSFNNFFNITQTLIHLLHTVAVSFDKVSTIALINSINVLPPFKFISKMLFNVLLLFSISVLFSVVNICSTYSKLRVAFSTT